MAGLVQAWVKKPTVSDLEELPLSVLTVKGFWINPVNGILLVVIFANLGATIEVFVPVAGSRPRSLGPTCGRVPHGALGMTQRRC